MIQTEQLEQMEKTGYLDREFRLFHIKDQTKKDFSFHYHDFHKVVVFLSGNVTYHIEGKAYRLEPWDILLVDRHAIHKPEIDASVPYERFILWIQNNIAENELTRCFRKASDRSYNLVRLHSTLQEKLKDILLELESSLKTEDFGNEILSNALFSQFMVYLNRIFLEKQYIFDQKSYSCDSQIANLIQYINRHLGEELTIEALAKQSYLSKYYLMRKFKEDTGYTIHNYITSKRLLMARSLIAEGTPVIKASQQSGFKEYSTFVRAYKRQFKKIPSQIT